jgi:hypothetical protein
VETILVSIALPKELSNFVERKKNFVISNICFIYVGKLTKTNNSNIGVYATLGRGEPFQQERLPNSYPSDLISNQIDWTCWAIN